MQLAVWQEQQQPIRERTWAHTVLGGKSQPAHVCRSPSRQSRTLISRRRSQRWPPRKQQRRPPPPWPTRRPRLLPPLGWWRRRRRRRRQLRLRRLQTTYRTCLWDLLGNDRSLWRPAQRNHRRANSPKGRTMCGGHGAYSLRQREEHPARELVRGGRRRCQRRSALVLCRPGRTLRRDYTPGRGAWSLQRLPHRQRCGCCGRIQCAPTRLYQRHLGRRRPRPRLVMPHPKIAPDRLSVQWIGRQAAALGQGGWLSAPRAALRGGGHGASPVTTTTTAAQTAAIMMRHSPATAPQ
jgi:hypothetical protein